jgi:hypothetical protein
MLGPFHPRDVVGGRVAILRQTSLLRRRPHTAPPAYGAARIPRRPHTAPPAYRAARIPRRRRRLEHIRFGDVSDDLPDPVLQRRRSPRRKALIAPPQLSESAATFEGTVACSFSR